MNIRAFPWSVSGFTQAMNKYEQRAFLKSLILWDKWSAYTGLSSFLYSFGPVWVYVIVKKILQRYLRTADANWMLIRFQSKNHIGRVIVFHALQTLAITLPSIWSKTEFVILGSMIFLIPALSFKIKHEKAISSKKHFQETASLGVNIISDQDEINRSFVLV